MAWEDDAQSRVPAPAPTVYEARFVNAATVTTDELRVKIPGYDDGVHAFDVGVTWAPRVGPLFPQPGDVAAVIEVLALDGESSSWWCISWTPA